MHRLTQNCKDTKYVIIKIQHPFMIQKTFSKLEMEKNTQNPV